MKVGFACDHTGFEMKAALMEHLGQKGYECVDYNTPEEAGGKVALVKLKGDYTGTIAVRVDVKQRPVTFTGKSDTKAYNGQNSLG